MQKKFIIAAFIVCSGLALTIYSFASGPVSKDAVKPEVQTEQINTSATDHCDPSNCTPEKAAACPYSNGAEKASTAASAECPATQDCPPSKCNTTGTKATI